MKHLEQSKLKVSEMVEGKEYLFTDWFFTELTNEKTIIKKERFAFYVTYSGGDFEKDQTVVFDYDAFAWFDYNVDVSNLTLSEIVEASVEFYTLFMSNSLDDDMHVQVIL
ncbi:hypothetical protein T458_05385 [Brevibacillus panacihumi W25]|uniref:Uncharacterized protein n=1 Tax=Brevibacillus panacihumi W25 TaxID=1408254 RepID=V6MB09_9BACL|nr:hypothetical protein [Brevibacillus panacihumi]EST55761.1 hypothetical protein T458_05385 [Brevibacillus panacihumi W25]